MIEVSEVLYFKIFLRVIRLDRAENLNRLCEYLFFEGFSFLVTLLDKLVLEIDLDLFTVFFVSGLSVYLNLSNDLTFLVLLLLVVSTVL